MSRVTTATTFEPQDWLVRLFLAGAINWGFLRLLAELYWNTNLEFLPFVSAVVGPLFLAVFLTRPLPEKRILPPAYIQLITLSWFGLTYFLWNGSEILLFGTVLLYSTFVLHAMTPFFVGRNGQKENIKILSFTANCQHETLEDILRSDYHLKSAIGILDDPIYKDEREIFQRDTNDPLFAEVEQLNTDKCRLNIILLQLRRYSISESEYFQELIERDIPYLKQLLSRRPISIILENDDPIHAERLRDFIFERKIYSITDHLSKLTGESWIKILFLLGSFAIPAYLWFGLNDSKDALITIAVLLVTLVLASAQELFKINKRRRR